MQSNSGRTALMIASKYDNYEIVKLLIDSDINSNININIQTKRGYTALIVASHLMLAIKNCECDVNSCETIITLLNAGADVTIINKKSKSVIVLLLDKKSIDTLLISLLLEKEKIY